MRAEAFVDTNVLLYSIDEDPVSAAKREAAQALLLSERWGWSVQVAAEFYVNATSPKRPFRLAAADAKSLIETWLAYPTLPISTDLLLSAIDMQQRFQLSYWDAAIIAAGRKLKCGVVYSEDLNHGQEYGICVVNPFQAVQSSPD